MFSLIRQLACSNLKKNRQLYYPFALATTLSTMIFYIFVSLTLNPNLATMRGGSVVQTTLGFGLVVVAITVGIIINYANRFVMKNRTKEMGLYEILGLNKGHLIHMMGLELVTFALLTLGLGVGLGLAFDQLVYAFLLKLMSWPVSLVATFQWSIVLITLAVGGIIFLIAWVTNVWTLGRLKALELNRESRKGEKKARFLLPKTILGLLLMGTGYYMAMTVQSPIAAIGIFFIAVLLVIQGTYLLFNAGITVFLQALKKRPSYYKPNNFIAVSNLIFRMKKNAMGLATIAILSTMVLVTIIGGINIYMGTTSFIERRSPQSFAWEFRVDPEESLKSEDLEAKLEAFKKDNQLEGESPKAYQYISSGVMLQPQTNELSFYDNYSEGMPTGFLTILDQESYEKMTGRTLNLAVDEVAINMSNTTLNPSEEIRIEGKAFRVKEVFTDNVIEGRIPADISGIVDSQVLMVVKDLDQVLSGIAGLGEASDQMTHLQRYIFVGFDTDLGHLSPEEQEELALRFKAVTSAHYDSLKSFVFDNIRFETAAETHSLMGSIFFIGLLLSLIFMLGMVLTIYYKQISEGYEDRHHFVILQQVGLDKQQINHTIRKQILIVFFLPLLFALSHLLAAFQMLSKIILLIVPTSLGQILGVTAATALLFIASYVIVFAITSRSYRRIISR